jgi:hypothetical protein
MSVALSADGNTALIGGPGDACSLEFRGCVGATWVFTRSGTTWSQQGPKLVGTPLGADVQGSSVALSADGNTALVGGQQGYYGAGAAWVFVRSGGTWSQQGPALAGAGAVGSGGVALSANGNTALVGGGWVFVRSGTTWSQQGPKLVSAGATAALSADGSTALIGGPFDHCSLTFRGCVGATWVFTRSGTTWSQRGPKLVGTGATGFASQGSSVALSVDGSTALVGGRGDNNGVGAAWVFALAPGAKITQATISSKHHRASFRFKAIGTATGFQCALIKQVQSNKKKHSPRFRRCRSPKLYKRLTPGRYQFLVRAVNPAAAGPPAKKVFMIH